MENNTSQKGMERKAAVNRRKMKLLTAGLITILLLTGAAYAAWTDSVDINVIATTAEMKIEITEKSYYMSSPLVEFTIDDIQIAADKKNADATIGNNYPGSEAVFALKIDNNGSIPVKLTEIYHDTRYVKDSVTGFNHGRNGGMFQYINAEYQIAVFDAEGTAIGMTETVNTESATHWEESYYVDNTLPDIEPGGFIALIVRVYFDSSADNAIMNKDFVFSVTPKFVQAE